MNLTVPLYVESRRQGSETLYLVRPLFFARPARHHERLERALHLLAHELRLHLHHLGKQPRHEELAAWSFNPRLDYQRIDLTIELRKRTARLRLLVVLFDALGRRVAFAPVIPDVWFELARGEQVAARAAEVLGAWFRDQEKDTDEEFVPPERFALEGTAWLSSLDVEVHPDQRLGPPENLAPRAGLGDAPPLDGEEELERVGRCLDRLYPDDLDRALLRDREVEELARLLEAPDRRPILLLGPRMVGKTTLLHEVVHRAVARRTDPYARRQNVWLLSPQRLISGMSYVGQWENRLLAILKEAQKRDHVLYCDDLLGLYHAGRTSQSDLSAAHVLEPYVERREVRLIAEATPEVLRVLQERDRGFADLFHRLPLAEPGDEDNLRLLIATTRQLEGQHGTRFDLDVLPTVIDLQRRYARGLSFPGKAALFLRRLAVKYRRGRVGRLEALQEFQAQSGLALGFLDGQVKLRRDDVIAALQQDVVGQARALEACADVLAIAKARLNDPDRPLASFLFLGPTGVGKTQCARAVARYLFGDAEHLVRFDMNEFLTPGAAARLAGTFDNPEGLLTAAVRRRPFAVILLDEIEKAHPEVFDLLLQVLGEGRLTDALGRTVDFGNTLIVLTSNLGVREAQQGMGFRPGEIHDPEAYHRAAQRFFRPEFFNRLDRVVPFDRLGRAEIGQIARGLLVELLQREGLARRKSLLRVEEPALEYIVNKGFDPVLGARALKRAIEQGLTRPVAAHLARGAAQTLTEVHVFPFGEDVAVDVRGLTEVPRAVASLPAGLDDETIRQRLHAVLRRVEGQFGHLRPAGAIASDNLQCGHLFYFVLQEQVRTLRWELRRLAEAQEDARRARQAAPALPVRIAPRSIYSEPRRNLLGEMAAAQDLRLYLEELASGAGWVEPAEGPELAPLVRRAALLEALAGARDEPGGEQVLVYLWCAGPGGQRWVDWLADSYREGGLTPQVPARWEPGDEETPQAWWHLEVAPLKPGPACPGRALLVRGLAAGRLAGSEEGTHLVCPQHGGPVGVQVHAWRVPDGVEPLAVLRERLAERATWLERLRGADASPADDPLGCSPVVRLYNEGQAAIDLRTGLVEPLGSEPAMGLRVGPFILAALPLPVELLE
jgi:ATP-dependent Clp protease ATP-binding subunit ClpA